MHVVTDDERREVAERLRGLASDADEVSDFDLAKTLDLCAVSRYGYDPRDVERLADLIDPSCDRDALLKLADELEEDACWEVQTPGDTSGAWRLKDACERIREACGEAVA